MSVCSWLAAKWARGLMPLSACVSLVIGVSESTVHHRRKYGLILATARGIDSGQYSEASEQKEPCIYGDIYESD